MTVKEKLTPNETEAVEDSQQSHDQSDPPNWSWQEQASPSNLPQSEGEIATQLDRIAAEIRSHEIAGEEVAGAAAQIDWSKDPVGNIVTAQETEQVQSAPPVSHDSDPTAGQSQGKPTEEHNSIDAHLGASLANPSADSHLDEAARGDWPEDALWDADVADALASAYSDGLSQDEQPDQQRREALSQIVAEQHDAVRNSSSEATDGTAGPSEIPSNLEARLSEMEAKLDKAIQADGNEAMLKAVEAKLEEALRASGNDELLGAIEAQISDMLGQLDRIAAEAMRIEVLEDGLASMLDDVAAVRKVSEEDTADALNSLMAKLEMLVERFDDLLAGQKGKAPAFSVPAMANAPAEENVPIRETAHLAPMDDRADVVKTVDIFDAPDANVMDHAQSYGTSAAVTPNHFDRADIIEQEVMESQQVPADALRQPPQATERYEAMAEAPMDEAQVVERTKPAATTREDFIAAARRAAQAAAEQSTSASAVTSRVREKQGQRKRFAAPSLDPSGSRPVLIVAIVALVTAGAGLL